MLNVMILTIPHERQRYPTVGDWQTPEEGFPINTILVSDMQNEDYEFAIAIHELIEMHLARRNGVNPHDVTRFDEIYESRRVAGDTSEPGDSPFCPVYKEHRFATIIEKLLIHEMGIDWTFYEAAVNSL